MNPVVGVIDGRLGVRCSGSAATAVKSLPGARWNERNGLWTLPATPAAAFRLSRALNGDTEWREKGAALLDQWERTVNFADFDPELEKILNKPPRIHQTEAFVRAYPAAGFLLWLAMSAGKTYIALGLAQGRKHRRVLVICPKKVIQVWKDQAVDHGYSGRVEDLGPDHASTAKKAARLVSLLRETDGPLLVVHNKDSVWRRPLADAILDAGFEMVIADEVQFAKSAGSSVSRFMARLAERVPYRLGLSGTPVPLHPVLDSYGIYRFLDAGIFGTSSASHKARYLEMVERERKDGRRYPVIDKTRNETEFRRWFDSICFVVPKGRLDLPPEQTVTRRFELSGEGRRIYAELREEMLAEFKARTITATNAGTRFMRFRQLASGFTKSEDGEILRVDHEKLELLSEVIDELGSEPAVIWYYFREDGAAIRAMLGQRSCEVSGDRDERHLWHDGGAQFLAAQVESGSEGIDLTRACYGIYFSVGTQGAKFEQSMARLCRTNQPRPVSYIRLVAMGTIDASMYAGHERKMKDSSWLSASRDVDLWKWFLENPEEVLDGT